jgi:hypothetical protein
MPQVRKVERFCARVPRARRAWRVAVPAFLDGELTHSSIDSVGASVCKLLRILI